MSVRIRSMGRSGILLLLTCPLIVEFSRASAGEVSYNFEVRPLLATKCLSCHGSDPHNRKGDLRLDTFKDATASAIKPGHPADSELIKRLLTDDPDEVMPPPEKHLELTSAQKELLSRWIAEGAKYETHWAFVPPVEPAAKTIDEIVQSALKAKGWNAAQPAPKHEWLRRVTLALSGVVPTLGELDAFLSDDSAKAKETVVDRLLASPRYGERMAAVWLDAARYADTYGRHEDQDNSMWPWRDWVIKSFNDNMPYDQFLTWQMAGDLLPQATQEQRLATAFHRLAMMTNEAGSDPEENRWMQIFDRIQVTSTSVLGLTLECAQCHDHKYDPFTMKDYYQLAAFFDKGDEFGLFPRFCNSTPPPSSYIYKPGQAAEHARLKQEITAAEATLRSAREGARLRYKAWCEHSAPPSRGPGLWTSNALPGGAPQRIPSVLPKPDLYLGFDAVDEKEHDYHISLSPDLRTMTQAAGSGGFKGVFGAACEFSEDRGGKCELPPELCYYRKYSPFTFSFWFTAAETPKRAVIMHRCRSGQDAMHRGYELMFMDGKLTASLAYYFPGNAIRIQAVKKVDFPSWRHVGWSYDGSGRAEGVRLFVDGEPLETTVIRDCLHRDIDYRVEWKDRDETQVADESDRPPALVLGLRGNDTGLRGAAIDELRAYDRTLSQAEMAFLSGRTMPASDEPWFDWYAREMDAQCVQAQAGLTAARKRETEFDIDLQDIMVMEDTPGFQHTTHLLERGNFRTPKEEVSPGTLAALNPMPAGAPQNRLGLAQWLVDEKNPLTARVQANRLWAMFFGRGLVATPQDFGVQGQVPALPELLDFIASRLRQTHWDMKALCREIALSATYGRSSLPADPSQVEADPENQYLARGPRFRLTAEQLRDSALAVSGLLSPKVGGPSVKPYQPEGLWEDSGTQHAYVQDKGDSLYRRSLYTFWRRTCPPPTMNVFDAPTREFCLVKRSSTMTPLQILAVWNDTGYLEAARVLAEKLVQMHPAASEDAKRVLTAFRMLTGKAPTPKQTEALAVLVSEGRAEFATSKQEAEKLLASAGEFARLPKLPPEEVAATMLMVRALFNAEPFVISY